MGKYAQMMSNGGMADSGQDMHPNGNEVPPGSLPQEVADDIDIKVSGGEYIVPADVTQYYGVKFFEDLRERAKQGLMQMEQRGRIGGQPAPGARPQPMADEDDLPFSEDELMVEETGEREFAEGGYNPAYQAPAGSRPNLGSSRFGNAMSTGGIDVRTYEDVEGNKKRITFVNGRPLQQIPAGFYPEGQVPAQAKTGTGSTENLQGEGDLQKAFIDREGLEREGRKEVEAFDPTGMSLEDMQSYANSRDWGGKALKALGVIGGGPGMIIGGIANQIFAGKTRKVYDEAERRAQEAMEKGDRSAYDLYKGIMNDIEDDRGGLLGEVFDGFGSKKEVGTAGGTTSGAATRSGAGSTGTSGSGGGDWADFSSSGGLSFGSDTPAAQTDWFGGTSMNTGEGDLGGGSVRDSFTDSYGSAVPDNNVSSGAGRDAFTDSYGSASPNSGDYSMGTPVSGGGYNSAPEEDYDSSGPFAQGGLVKKRAKFKSSRKK